MQPNILYYDKEAESACMDICDYLKIDNLPGINGRSFFEFQGNKFLGLPVRKKHRVQVSDTLFERQILNKFRDNRHNVLFVYEGDVLRGVVHFSDYNKDALLQSIQDDVLSFERKLRQLILLNGFTNADMLAYFRIKSTSKGSLRDKEYYESRLKYFDRKFNEIESLGPFQLFDFSDLLNFSASSYTGAIHKTTVYKWNGAKVAGAEILKELRNMAMHGKNPVAKNKSTSIYSMDSLEKLSFSLRVLRKEYSSVSKKIRQHPDLLRSIELDNRSKLEIIHSHHPKALEYFLGW